MKLLVVSDSHGRVQNIESAIEKETPDKVIFTGDGLRDFEKIEESGFLETLNIGERHCSTTEKIIKVAGNCDYFNVDTPLAMVKDFNGVKAFLTHGHLFKVKFGMGGILKEAKELRCNLLIFGHTHSQLLEVVDGITLVNPGSIANGKYAIIEIENCKIQAKLKSL